MPIPTFDGINLLITLPATVNGLLSIDVERDLYSEWKEWSLLSDNIKFPFAFRGSVGGDVLQGTLEAGAYFFLQNQKGWRIKPFEGNGEYTFTGNLVAQDENIRMIKPTTGAFNVLINGLQPITQNISAQDVEHASFNGGVTLDAVNGVPGTTGTTGNTRTPSNNLADAKTIASTRGFSKLFIINNFTFGATDNIDNFTVVGANALLRNTVTITAGCSTVNTRFENCQVQGTLSGHIEADTVIFNNTVDMGYMSWIINAWFTSDITLKGPGPFTVIDSGNGVSPSSTARSNFDYALVALSASNFLRWSGNIGFKNVTLGDISLDMNAGSGDVFIDLSNTGGTIRISPDNTAVYDQSAGTTVIGGSRLGFVVADVGNTNLTFKTDLISSVTDSLKDVLITFLTGPLKDQVKQATLFNGTTKFATVAGGYTGAPNAGDKFRVGSK